MKKTVNENMTPDKATAHEGSVGLGDAQTADIGNQRLSNAAPLETAEKAVATPTKAIAEEAFDVRPSETVSIIAGNRVLFLGEGLREIRITK